MKIIIASDIHGSAYWAERLIEAIDTERPDRVVLLGDLLYHGPVSYTHLDVYKRQGEYFATNEEYIRKYRFAGAFHPFHGFSMMSCGNLAEKYLSATYIVGAQQPGIARTMGLKTRPTFEEAIADATRKYTDGNPNILALPGAYVSACLLYTSRCV